MRALPADVPAGLPRCPPAVLPLSSRQVAHYKADALYLTNDNPGTVWPSEIIEDMVRLNCWLVACVVGGLRLPCVAMPGCQPCRSAASATRAAEATTLVAR